MTRRGRAALAAALVLGAAACSNLRDQAVPGCPYCGDPLTVRGPDGSPRVLARWRLREWETVPPRSRLADGDVGRE